MFEDSLEKAPCGVKLNSKAINYDPKLINCQAIKAGRPHGLAHLNLLEKPNNVKDHVVFYIDPQQCSRYRGETSLTNIDFPCPLVLEEMEKEVKEAFEADFSAEETKTYIKEKYGPGFVLRASTLYQSLTRSY